MIGASRRSGGLDGDDVEVDEMVYHLGRSFEAKA